MISITAMIGIIFKTMAYQKCQASKIAPLNYMRVVYQCVYGIVFLHNPTDFLEYLGMTLVISLQFYKIFEQLFCTKPKITPKSFEGRKSTAPDSTMN